MKNLEFKIHIAKWFCVCLAILIVIALITKYISGDNPLLQQSPETYVIYFSIISSFVWATIRCAAGLKYLKNPSHLSLENSKHIEREGWFWSTTCTSLGLIGTIWGMIIMTQAFIGFNPGNDEVSSNLIAAIGSGMGTALYTTLVGQVCSQILNFQYFGLSQKIERLK